MSELPSTLCSPFTKLSYRILARDSTFRSADPPPPRSQSGGKGGGRPLWPLRERARERRPPLSLSLSRCTLLLHFLYLSISRYDVTYSRGMYRHRHRHRHCHRLPGLPLNRSPKFEATWSRVLSFRLLRPRNLSYLINWIEGAEKSTRRV